MTLWPRSAVDAATPGGGILRRASRNLAFLTAGKSVSGVLSLVYLALAVRTLGVDAYGQLILIYSFAGLVTAIVQFQTWQPILHYGTPALADGRMGGFRRLIRFAIGLDLASAVVGMAVVAGGIWLLGPWIDLPDEVLPLASMFGAAVPFMVAATPNGLLRLFDRFDLLLVEDNVEAVVRLLGSLVLFLIGGGLAGFLLVWGLSVVASGCVCALLAWREFARRVNSAADEPAARERLGVAYPGIWRFVWSTNLNSSLKLSRNHIATMVIGAGVDSTGAGLFRIAQQLADALAKPLKLMTPVLYPELARLASAKNFAVLRQVHQRALLYSSIGAVACFLLVVAVGPLLLNVIGDDQTNGAYQVMLLLSAASLIRIATFALEPTLISLGRPTWALGIQAAATLAYLPLLVVLIAWIGLNGAGAAAIVAAVFTALLQLAAVSFWFPSGTGSQPARGVVL